MVGRYAELKLGHACRVTSGSAIKKGRMDPAGGQDTDAERANALLVRTLPCSDGEMITARKSRIVFAATLQGSLLKARHSRL